MDIQKTSPDISAENSPKTAHTAEAIATVRADVVARAAGYAAEYLAGVDERGVAPATAAVDALAELCGAVPEGSTDAAAVVEMLHRVGSPGTVASSGGRYFGFVVGGMVPAALGAGVLANAWNQNAGMQAQTPTAAILEATAVRWVAELLGLPEGTGGAVVTGATMANFCGLAAARHALLERAGWDLEADGLFGAPPITVVVGDEVHSSVIKALGMLGMGRRRVVRVPVDGQGRMRIDSLPRLDERTIVCLQAGNVNTGSFDPAGAICPAARELGAWIHVDGAFGLWATTSEKLRHLTAGFELADSWATDGHKWPNVGYDCGVALVREPKWLKAAMAIQAAYLVLDGAREPSHYNPELSRRARGVELWAALKSLGRAGLGEIVERTTAQAQRFAEGLRAAGCRVLNDVVINQVLVQFGAAEETLRVASRLQAEGTCWCGTTVWQGQTAMRISVSSWATTEADVALSLGAMLRAAARQ